MCMLFVHVLCDCSLAGMSMRLQMYMLHVLLHCCCSLLHSYCTVVAGLSNIQQHYNVNQLQLKLQKYQNTIAATKLRRNYNETTSLNIEVPLNVQ